MSRKVGSSGPRTEEAIRAAGLDLIHKHGYEAMTLRDLAREVGVQSGSLYRYFPSKQDLLVDLLTSNMEEMLRQWSEASDGLSDPLERLEAFVAFHIGYHTERPKEVFICAMELRSLEPANYAKVVALRRTYERHLLGILQDGVREKLFRVEDAQVAAFGILAMLTGVCTWYRPDGRLGKRKLVAMYVRLICRGLLPGDAPTSAKADAAKRTQPRARPSLSPAG